MGGVDRAGLARVLERHYAVQRQVVSRAETDHLANLMLAEDARARKADFRVMGIVGFVASQVRYIPAWTWVAQVIIVALMVAVAYASGSAMATKLAVGILSAASVLVGVPTLQASKRYGVTELEYSCRNNAASVMFARFVILGCSSSLAVAIMVAMTASGLDTSALTVALWACPPFFCSCAGSLALLRKASVSSAAAMCAVWVAACSIVLVAFASILPDMYESASFAIWAGAAIAALAWLAREIAVVFRSVAAGLDAFSPHAAMTDN